MGVPHFYQKWSYFMDLSLGTIASSGREKRAKIGKYLSRKNTLAGSHLLTNALCTRLWCYFEIEYFKGIS